MESITGNIVDVFKRTIYPGRISMSAGRIKAIERTKGAYKSYIMPGFIDAHVHIESSMLSPREFGRAALVHGTVAAVCDPHEIANILGIEGIDYMISDAHSSPLLFSFGAPSCVPATPFETACAALGPEDIEHLMARDDIGHLAEVMNYPGVIERQPEIISKIQSARKRGKPVDGHAPGLRGDDLRLYASAGITTNHECFSPSEAKENIEKGMNILIREGSAAKNFDDLIHLLEDYPDKCMLCSDDKHPDDLIQGHINTMVKRAVVDHGIDIMTVLRAASINPAIHYGLEVGLLRTGDRADFIEVDNLTDLNVLSTFIEGKRTAREGSSLLPFERPEAINHFKAALKTVHDIEIPAVHRRVNVIQALDGQLITRRFATEALEEDGRLVSDTERDILKMVVVNRYAETRPALGFVSGFGLKQGAIASSIAHDSHNIIAAGVTDEEIVNAINLVINNRGGIAAVTSNKHKVLPLPIAGIMSDNEYSIVASTYTGIERFAKSLGSSLSAPFMTLSFMSLPVIPEIKLTDRGLFDTTTFRHISLYSE